MPVKLLLLIPCYNEAEALPGLLSQLKALNLPAPYQVTTIVINDGSIDNTAAIALQQQVEVLDLPINLGIGGAVQSGLAYALQNNFDLAIQIDGDGQHRPDEIIKLLTCYEATGANLIIGSRFIERKGFQSTFARRLGIAYFHWLNKLFTGQRSTDSTSGFRLFDRQAIQLAAAHYPDEYPEPESLILFARAGLVIKETPVQMAARNGGRSSIRNFASLYYCIKVTIAMLFAAIRKPQ